MANASAEVIRPLRRVEPEYWIVNLFDRCIEVHTGVSAGSYSHVETFARGQSIRPGAFPDVELSVADVLK